MWAEKNSCSEEPMTAQFQEGGTCPPAKVAQSFSERVWVSQNRDGKEENSAPRFLEELVVDMKQESMPEQLPRRPEIGEARPRAQTSHSKYSFFSKRRDRGPHGTSRASSKVDVSNISSGYFGGALQL